jgi:DNA gyrase/topoisomerase IV subunit B
VPDFVKGGGDFAFSLVNAIPLFNGGTHIDAFRKGFYNGLLSGLERESKRRKLTPNRSDVSEGLLIYATLEMAAPSFDSQAKARLINETSAVLVRKMLDDPEFFKDCIKKNPEWISSIYTRCAERTQVKDSKDATKQAKKNLRQKIEDLEDACGHDRSKCILFLTEGRSAAASISQVRNPQIYGSLPMRGKLLNTFDQTNKIIIENRVLASIMSAVGLVPGQRANRHSLRYGAIYLTGDADPDGANITALLVQFFYSGWPELFDPDKQPYIYVFNTPLIIASKGKQRKYWYADDHEGFDPDKHKGWEITRAKGLAALVKEDWVDALIKPKLQPIIDDGLSDALALIFDPKRPDDRKQWMSI